MLWHGDSDQPGRAGYHLAHGHAATRHRDDGREPRPDAGAGTAGITSPRAGTETAAFSTEPASVSSLTVAATASARRVGQRAGSPGAPPTRGLSRAVPGGGLGVGRTRPARPAPQRADRCRGAPGTGRHADPATTTTTSTSTLQRCSRLWWAGVMRRPCCAGRGTPWTASEERDQEDAQASTSSRTPSGTSGNCESWRLAGPA